jgi:hypothetical protein
LGAAVPSSLFRTFLLCRCYPATVVVDLLEYDVSNAAGRWFSLGQKNRKEGGLTMRILIICAIVLTGTVALGGCFHHEKAVATQPLKLG